MGNSRNIVRRILQYADDAGVLLHAADDSRVHCIPYRRQRLIAGYLCVRRLTSAATVSRTQNAALSRLPSLSE